MKNPIFQRYLTAWPAATAGLAFGDQIVSVNGKPFHQIMSFTGLTNTKAMVEIKRNGVDQTVNVDVVDLDGRTMFATALDASTKIVQHNGKKIGYAHVWSYAGPQYQEKIRTELLWGKLSACDAFVLDLRDGWGGADPSYLNLFRKPIMDIQAVERDGTRQNYTGVWGKPVAVIVNGRSTSGKELFVFGFKKLKLGAGDW